MSIVNRNFSFNGHFLLGFRVKNTCCNTYYLNVAGEKVGIHFTIQVSHYISSNDFKSLLKKYISFSIPYHIQHFTRFIEQKTSKIYWYGEMNVLIMYESCFIIPKNTKHINLAFIDRELTYTENIDEKIISPDLNVSLDIENIRMIYYKYSYLVKVDADILNSITNVIQRNPHLQFVGIVK